MKNKKFFIVFMLSLIFLLFFLFYLKKEDGYMKSKNGKITVVIENVTIVGNDLYFDYEDAEYHLTIDDSLKEKLQEHHSYEIVFQVEEKIRKNDFETLFKDKIATITSLKECGDACPVGE